MGENCPSLSEGVLFVSDLLRSGCTRKVIPNLFPGGLIDSFINCFNNELRFPLGSQSFENHSTAWIGFLSMGWIFEPFSRGDCASFEVLSEKPKSCNDMVKFAKVPSCGILFVRAYFYGHSGEVRK